MSSKSAAQNSDSSHSNASSRSNSKPIDAQMQMRGATLGKLHEIDLGEEIKLKNAMRTEAAVRRLEGGQPVEPEEEQTGKKKWRKRRRNSQDIQRDKLVEEVLKETRRKPILLERLPRFHANIIQWNYTRNHRTQTLMTTRREPQTTRLLKSSGKNLWMLLINEKEGAKPYRRRRKRMRRHVLKVLSSAVVGWRELPCGSSRQVQKSNLIIAQLCFWNWSTFWVL